MPHPNLTAQWNHVVVATWAVPAGVLGQFLPPPPPAAAVSGAVGYQPLEVDLFGRAPLLLPDGKPGAAISLMAYQCRHVKILGVKWPYLRNFCAWSVRFSVKQGDRRGVVYVREVVPRRVVAWGARKLYNQPCVAAPIEEEVKQQTLLIGAEYRCQWPTGGLAPGAHATREMATTEQVVRVVGRKPQTRTAPTSVDSWLTDRPFIFGQWHDQTPLVYEAIHPTWSVYPAVDAMVRVDFASMFSPALAFLSEREPDHAMLAVGSEAAVFPRRDAAGVRWGTRRDRAGAERV